jgi:D-alanyl-D-alanine carboxypeptidase
LKYFLSLLAILFYITGCTKGEEESAEMPLHPDFTITMSRLEPLVEDLPKDIRLNILNRPEYFLQLLKEILSQPEDTFYLVDKDHALPAEYAPEDLVLLSSYPISINRSNLELRAGIIPDTLAMAEAARQDGIDLTFSSAYRSYSYQKKVYERNVKELGVDQADRESARPGNSQHQLGTAVDFGSITDEFTYHPAGIWLAEHAWEYGFSLSYPKGMEELTGYKYEPWHFRHITRKGTEMEREFFTGIQHYFLLFLHRHREILSGYMAETAVS